MDIEGYVNPRSLGNDEPNRFLQADIFIEQVLWDRYVAHKKDVHRQNVKTWDVTFMTAMACRGASGDMLRRGIEFECKIGHHKPCVLRAYQHPRYMALCVGQEHPS